MRPWTIALLLVAACGKSSTGQIPAYLAGDPCASHGDRASCAADSSCLWDGFCQTHDPCAAHGDEASCTADASCMWAGIVGLCPPDRTCPESGGFCTTRPEDGCACACPAVCPNGADCPPCACDCRGGGTCACPAIACAPAAPCPPVGKCDCEPPAPGCVPTGGTCTCACPACMPGETCPPCTCDCGATPAPPPAMANPCGAHTDEGTCRADAANGCVWAAILLPCVEGQPCPTGSCYGKPTSICPDGTPAPAPMVLP